MMIPLRAIRRTAVACVVAVLLGAFASHAAAPQMQAKQVPAPRANSSAGAELYQQHCVVCHGDDLKGVGPNPAPYRMPPDLSTLARRHGGEFPTTYVADVLRNGVTLPAHGPAEMPTWGTDFKETDRLDGPQVKLRIANLTNYLKSRQVK